MTLVRRALLISMVVGAAALSGCTSLLGDFTVGAGDDGGADATGGNDGAITGDSGLDGATMGDAAFDGSMGDAGTAHLHVDNAAYDFMTHPIGASVGVASLTITNDGTGTTAPLSVSIVGAGFSFSGGTCMGAVLHPNESCGVGVAVDTSRIGMFTGTATFADGASDMATTRLAANIVMACPVNMPTICNGTCVDLNSDPQNCMTCGHGCVTTANGQPTCNGGVCGINCATNYHLCGNTCADSTSVSTCGSMCTACGAIANGTVGCVNGSCSVSQCSIGYQDCNMTESDGCEANTTNDPQHCGSCTACNLPNAQAACVNSRCAIAAGGCAANYQDCNMMAGDGCEANVLSDVTNCGGCGGTCSGGKICSGGHCACATGQTFCAGPAVCIDLQTDMHNCGTCGHDCLGGACVGGACQPVVLYSLPTGGQGIAVDAASVYFTDGSGGHVYKCPLSGCAGNLVTLLSGLGNADSVYYDGPSNTIFAADGQNSKVYSLTPGGTLNYSVLSPGANSGYSTPRAFYADSNYVYWGNNGGGTTDIDRALKSNGTGIIANNSSVAPARAVWSLAYDSVTDHLFAATFSANTIASCPRTGGACTSLATSPTVTGVVVVGSQIFFSTRGTGPSYTDGGIFTATTALTGYQVLASGNQSYSVVNGTLTADAANVYWGGPNSGKIYKCAVSGCASAPTAISPAGSFYTTDSMTNDANAIYWAGGGQVVKLAK